MSGRPPPQRQASVEGTAADAGLAGVTSGGFARAAASWLDQLPGGVFQLRRDADGCWTFPYINATLSRLLGMSAAGLRRDARTIRAILGAEALDTVKQRLDQSRETGVAWKARLPLRRLFGPPVWVEVTASPESCADASILWCGFVTDVTYEHGVQRATAERYERHQHALRAAGIGLLEFDAQTLQFHLDAQTRQLHGLDNTSADLALMQWLALLQADDQDVAHRLLTTAAPTPSPLVMTVQLMHRPGHAPRSLELVLTNRTPSSHGGSDAPHAGWSGSCRDISAQLHAQAQRDQHTAQQAERARNAFLSHISHELRTPLNGVLGYAQLMALDQEYPLPPAQAQRLAVLQDSSARLLRLVDQQLGAHGMPPAPGRPLHPEVVDLQPLVAHCVKIIAPLAQTRGIQIEVALNNPGSPPAHVRADRAALAQVIEALISNAVKFNRPQGRVRIRFVQAEMGTLIVDDTGPGLTRTQLMRLFAPLSSASSTAAPLNESPPASDQRHGLITACRLTQAMGGKLKAWSQPGTGSRFAVSLALAKPERPVGTPESDFASLEPSQWDGGAQRLVLYVEDDEVNTTLMEQVFVMRPEWRLITAGTGEEGMAAAITHQPELALIDIGLPDMSGIEVMHRLKADPRTRHIHCVALSADSSPDAMQRGKAAGFEDYWTKPFDIVTMVNRLQNRLA